MLSRSNQRIGLLILLTIICLVIAAEAWQSKFVVREGIEGIEHPKERTARCETEAQDWIDAQDIDPLAKGMERQVKKDFIKQCETIGLMGPAFSKTYDFGEAYQDSKYANEVLALQKRMALYGLRNSFARLELMGGGLEDVLTSEKPDAVLVRNMAAALNYIDLIEKNKTPSIGATMPKMSKSSSSSTEKNADEASSIFSF